MVREKGKVPREQRKLIYSGLDIPVVDPRGPNRAGEPSLTPQLERVKQLPFDGIAVHLQDPNPKRQYPENLLGNNLFGGVRHRYDDFQGAVPLLKRLKETGKSENFLPIVPNFWFETGKNNKFDWFNEDRIRTTEENLRTYARLAREAGTIRGFILDVEPYRKPGYLGGEEEWAYSLFSLNVQFNLVNNLAGKPNPKALYENRLRECGKRFYRALDENLKGAPILLYLGYGLTTEVADPNRADLFPHFMDGMLEELDRRRTGGYIVDGTEGAYKYRRAEEYRAARQSITGDLKRYSRVPKQYEKHMRVGFGKWLDAGTGADGVWDATNFDRNYYSPAQWEESLRFALENTDEYVWVWTAGVARFFDMTYGRKPSVPEPYLDATRRAKKRG